MGFTATSHRKTISPRKPPLVLGNEGWIRRLTGTAHPSFGEVVRSYLSPRHRDDPGHGCLFAALGSDVVRQPRSIRRAFTEGVRSRIDTLQDLIPGRSIAARRQKSRGGDGGSRRRAHAGARRRRSEIVRRNSGGRGGNLWPHLTRR